MYLALKWVNLRQVIQNGGSTNLHPPNHRTHNSGSPLSVSHAAQPKTTNFWTFYPTATYVCPINKEASWSTICWLLTLLALLQCVIGNQTLFDLLAAEPFGTAAMCYRQTNTVAHRQKQGMPKKQLYTRQYTRQKMMPHYDEKPNEFANHWEHNKAWYIRQWMIVQSRHQQYSDVLSPPDPPSGYGTES